jgi:hypothetical protein
VADIDFNQPNVPVIKIVGQALHAKYPQIKDWRQHFAFDFDARDVSTDGIIKAFIETNLNIKNVLKFDIVRKQITDDGLNPHFDNYQLMNGKIPADKKDGCIEITKDKKYLKYQRMTNDAPDFTVLLYSSTHGVNFTGGMLHFVDGTSIVPKKGTGLIFSGLEAHYVDRVVGERFVTVVKLHLDRSV